MTARDRLKIVNEVARMVMTQLNLVQNGTKLRKKDSPKEKFQAAMRRQFRKKNN